MLAREYPLSHDHQTPVDYAQLIGLAHAAALGLRFRTAVRFEAS